MFSERLNYMNTQEHSICNGISFDDIDSDFCKIMNKKSTSIIINSDWKRLNINKEKIITVTDPPFNIGYKYKTYKDSMKVSEYWEMLEKALSGPCVLIHYPEDLCEFCARTGRVPTKVCSWVYPSNNAKQHRVIGFFDCTPNFRAVKGEYRNPTDKRVRKLIEQGKSARAYDWIQVNQVKGNSRVKTNHPCQMPVAVMDYVVGLLPSDYVIFDPFLGSGTTGVSCAKLGRNFIGSEIVPEYFITAKKRIENAMQNLS